MSSFIEASLRTLGDVGKMGGLEAVAVAPGLTEAVVVDAENHEKIRETLFTFNTLFEIFSFCPKIQL